MSEHRATVTWQRNSAGFDYESFSRDHAWSFEGGPEVPASAAPDFRGSAARVDPEEAFVAAIASCHMLTFLAIAAKRRLIVNRYSDHAVGYLEENKDGKLHVARVVLRPEVAFYSGTLPTDAQIAKMHESAHRECFIANSVRTEIRIEPAAS